MPKNKKYISVISVLDVLRTGDDPIIVQAEDENAYLIKHNIRGNMKRNMACEWMCYRLFKHFKVSTPNAELLSFEPLLFRDELVSLTGLFQKHVVFGSRWLDARDVKDELYEGKTKKSESLSNPAELAQILVMDLWLKNSDRQPLNMNMIVSKQRLYAIDHSATFDQLSFVRLAEPVNKEYFVQPGEIGDLIISSDYFAYYFGRYSKEFEEAGLTLCRKIEETDETLLNSIFGTLPVSWNISGEEQNSIVEYLIYRKSKLKNLFTEHLNFSR